MSKEDKIEVEGVIVKALPWALFEVKLPDDFGGGWIIIRAYISWKMRKNFINLIEWDSVLVELTPYDLSRWRIIFRKK
ncbi:MAG: translation initiation factor IF-1 [uncultured bacterium (gcode 4)]|uniref:Translation initiation factor IF-1 n=1 Tax=uncultured bacterium (gcode 4) TaxID=1234023 RepID=K2FVS6_9BACT|nr:MAG: translation initiation factor IF-1 [uncultured bacterium (gcode 4)]